MSQKRYDNTYFTILSAVVRACDYVAIDFSKRKLQISKKSSYAAADLIM